MKRCRFTENRGVAQAGAVIATSTSILNVEFTDFIKNSASNGAGGAITVTDADQFGSIAGAENKKPAVLNIRNCDFIENAGLLWGGGGVYLLNALVRISSSRFIANYAIPPGHRDTVRCST